MAKLSKKTGAIAGITVAAAAGIAAAIALTGGVSDPSVRAASEDALRRGALAFSALERSDVEKLSSQLDALLARPELLELYRARDREKLLAWASPIFRSLQAKQGVTHWYFLDPEPARTCFLRVHAPELHGDVVNRDTFSQAIASHDVGSGKELGKTAFALRVVKPLRAGDAIVGYVELGEEINHFLERMKADTGDDFGLLVDKRLIDRAELARLQVVDRWADHPDVVLVDSTVWNERVVDLGVPVAQLPAEGRMLGEWADGSRTFVGAAFPVRSAAGVAVGALFVRHDITEMHAQVEASRNRAFSIATMVTVALAAVGIAFVAGARRGDG
jgi:Double sensory domain of two-component sensor kinase